MATRPRRSATPYELYTSSASASPFRPVGTSTGDTGSVFTSTSRTPVRGHGVAGSALATPASLRGVGADSSFEGSPFRRNVPFGSPGLRAAKAGSASAGRLSEAARSVGRSSLPPSSSRDGRASQSGATASGTRKRIIRRKPLAEKLAALPEDIYHSLSLRFSIYLNDIQELPPQAGVVLGGLLHLLSILAHITSPDSEFSFAAVVGLGGSSVGSSGGLFGKQGKKTKGLFVHEKADGLLSPSGSQITGSTPLGGTVISPAEQMRRIAQFQKEAWLRGLSISLSLTAILLASYNAYFLFVRSRRQYQLWMKSSDDVVKSENARLVPLVREEDQLSLQDRAFEFFLKQLRQVPVVKWFVPRDDSAWRRENGAGETAKMYTLDVWKAPPLNLSIFCVYPPIYGLWYHFAGLAGIKGPISWIVTWLLMAAIGFQMHWLLKEFQGLIKDKQLIAGEVMNEYEQKFVFPRAMPEMADASTMTNEAEMVGWRSSVASHAPSSTKKGRAR